MEAITPLEKILFPHSIALFYEQYFEKQPLLIQRQEASYFHEVLNIDDVNAYLEKKDIRYPAIRLVKDGLELPQTSYLKNLPFGGQTFDRLIDNDKMFHHFAEGSSIVLQAFHRTSIPLVKLVQRLEKHFNFPLQTNIYLTPASSQGFNAHFDNHDVFLLQVYGSKIWKVYDAPVYLPKRPFNKTKWKPTPPIIEVELKAGDTLYMPRGFVHEGLTANSASMHITLGLLTYTWLDVLRLLADEAQDIPQCRESLPVENIGAPHFRERLPFLFGEILNHANFEKIRDQLSGRFIKRSMSADDNRLHDILSLENINSRTIVASRKEINFTYRDNEDCCTLQFYDKSISFPKYAGDALDYIFRNDKFRVAEMETCLDESGKIVLVKKLVKEGFLKIVQNE